MIGGAAFATVACLALAVPAGGQVADPFSTIPLPAVSDTLPFTDDPREATPLADVIPATVYRSAADLQPTSDADRLARLEQELKQLTDAEQTRKAAAAKRPGFAIAGQLQADYLWFGQGAASRAAVGDIEDFSDIRRARFTARGEAFEVVEYALGFDFALPGRPSFLDVFVGVHDLPYVGNFRVGHFFEPFSLERLTRNRYNTFMERSLADTFAPARNLGMEIYDTIGESERGTWAVGWFRTGSDDFGDDAGDDGEQAVTTRVTWLPFYDDASDGRAYLHLGFGYSFRDADEGLVVFRTTPEARGGALNEGQVPFFVNTGNIPAEHVQLFGAELAWTAGPLAFQSEYMHVPVEQLGGPGLAFQGAYAQVTYFLTGEHRPYNRKFGYHDRVVPFENFFRVRTDEGVANGLGAWELAARWSYIDLEDANISGGMLENFTLGLNWYLNPYTRVKWQYIRADLDRAPFGQSTTHIAGMRFDIDF